MEQARCPHHVRKMSSFFIALFRRADLYWLIAKVLDQNFFGLIQLFKFFIPFLSFSCSPFVAVVALLEDILKQVFLRRSTKGKPEVNFPKLVYLEICSHYNQWFCWADSEVPTLS